MGNISINFVVYVFVPMDDVSPSNLIRLKMTRVNRKPLVAQG